MTTKTEEQTIPWIDEELITINGQKLAYELRGENRAIIVHFSGEKVSLAQLIAIGAKITMPKIIRGADL